MDFRGETRLIMGQARAGRCVSGGGKECARFRGWGARDFGRDGRFDGAGMCGNETVIRIYVTELMRRVLIDSSKCWAKKVLGKPLVITGL